MMARDGGKDFRVEVRVKSARILRAIAARGFKSVAEFARANGLEYTGLCRFIRMEAPPVNAQSGDWSDWALGLSSALALEPEEIWPQHIRHIRANGCVSAELNLDEVSRIPAGGDYDALEAKELLDRLPPRDRTVIDAIYGTDGNGASNTHYAAAEMGISTTRIRQLEARALKRMGRWAKTAVTDANCGDSAKH